MSKLYAIVNYDYDGYAVVKVFKTLERAEHTMREMIAVEKSAFIQLLKRNDKPLPSDIHEWSFNVGIEELEYVEE